MYLSKLPTPHHLTHLRATSFDNGAETPLPYFPEQEQAVLSAKEAYAATRMLYTRAHAKLQAVLAQMPDGFEQGQPPSKGVAKPDPVLLEQLDTLEPQVREQSKLLEGAKFQLRLASGRRPLRNEFLEGPQTACCAKARSKAVPFTAMLSITGVCRSSSP